MKTQWLNTAFHIPVLGSIIMIWHIVYDEPDLILYDDENMLQHFKNWYPSTKPVEIIKI